MRYLVLNVLILGLTTMFTIRAARGKQTKPVLLSLLILVALTAVFDSFIVANHIVEYHSGHFLNIFVGRAPLEDFAYTIASVLLMNYLLTRKRDR